MTPEQALQLISEALEPRNIHAISRQGFVTLDRAIHVLADAIKSAPKAEYAVPPAS